MWIRVGVWRVLNQLALFFLLKKKTIFQLCLMFRTAVRLYIPTHTTQTYINKPLVVIYKKWKIDFDPPPLMISYYYMCFFFSFSSFSVLAVVVVVVVWYNGLMCIEWWRQGWSRHERGPGLAKRIHRKRGGCIYSRWWHPNKSSGSCPKLCEYKRNYIYIFFSQVYI